MNQELKLGMIGLDTSHCTAFAKILNDSSYEHYVPGGRVMAAYPGGSPDLYASYSCVDGYRKELNEQYGIAMLDSPEEVAERSDAILLTSVDGRKHPEQFSRIAPYGKPVFIDKPFALSRQEAEAIFEQAAKYNVVLMGSSSLRYAEEVTQCLVDREAGAVIGADVFSPMPTEPTNPGWFWYGIHGVEMLYTAMSTGCKKVRSVGDERSDQVVGVWEDGRIGTVRGNRTGVYEYGAMIHREKSTAFVTNVFKGGRPLYVPLLKKVMEMFQTGISPIDPAVTIELTRFMEAANESRRTGADVYL
ncbi:Gfo/Idh/MocA family protein [Paenibacillus cymbidii]|uniref:Gfo/Idh/MocA family protein n=1 Tax=Paenibacillus cymbidii TaxID=1639034 RepID=UPI001F1F81AB|nr:Gfo/Idh/MocA family oxidoreductase [Paenibacillus cymbidii]